MGAACLSIPYSAAPSRAFWSRSVARAFDPTEVGDPPPFALTAEDRFMSAGSCFASNIRRYLENWGCQYTVTERPHPLWPEARETPYYEAFSARYGNVYTARHMAQLLDRATGRFEPAESYWEEGGTFIDPFRPGLRHRARSLAEFVALTDQHLAAVREAIRESSVFVYTLGLTEAWTSADDGAVFPVCPGTVAGTFDARQHLFVNFDVDEVTADLVRVVATTRALNASLKVILTVSPVPLVATATGSHVLAASTYSKSVLRVAAARAAALLDDVAYFPAYELVVGPQNNGRAFAADRRNVTEEAVADVMAAFRHNFFDAANMRAERSSPAGRSAARERVAQDDSASLASAIARSIAERCEEEMLDDELAPSAASAPI